MGGSPQVVRFDATTLWHLDAAEWAPSTASKADVTLRSDRTSALPSRTDVCDRPVSSSSMYQMLKYERRPSGAQNRTCAEWPVDLSACDSAPARQKSVRPDNRERLGPLGPSRSR